MKILLLGSKEYPFGSSYKFDRKAGGGIEIHVDKLSKYLSRNNQEVFIITRQFPGQGKRETKGNVRVFRTGFLYNRFLRAVTFNLFGSLKALKVIRGEGINLIHCHGPIAGFFGAILSKLTGVPMVFTPHGTVTGWCSPIREIIKFFEIVSVKGSKKTLFISKRAQEELTRNYDFQNTLLTNAIDLEDFSPGKRTWEETRFLFLGRLEEVKGPKYLLEAFKKLAQKKPHIRLYIAGEGTMKKHILDFIHKNNLGDKIKFLGWVTNTPKLLKETDVFVLPSWEKGQPVALLEAMASGKIIITSLDYIDKETGLRIKPKNTGDLYNKMNSVCNDLSKYKKLGANAREQAKELSWDRIVKMFIKEYESILKT